MTTPDDPGSDRTLQWEGSPRVCPTCDATFAPHVEVCPDDGTPLVDAIPGAGNRSDSGPAAARTPDEVIHERLDAAGAAASTSDEDPLVGTLIRDKWKVLGKLGAGSFGTVYKVEDVKGGWIEALKILGVDRLSGAEAENARARFLREAQIMKRLGNESQHIVGLATYEEDLEAGLVYFLMEFVEGRPLSDVVDEEGPFDVERTLRLAIQACEALTVAHEGPEAVVHRDLKLENLMLTRDRSGDEMVKILDFGIAKLAEQDPEARLTTVGTLGTPGYAAPEQLRAEDVDARTDLFAFGVILYSMLTGLDPWLGNPAAQPTAQIYDLMVQTERGQVRPMADTGVDVPPAMESVVLRLLRREPAERFQSARELKDALLRVQEGGDALDAGSVRVVTEEPGVEVQIRSGLRSVARGPTPLVAHNVASGGYKVSVEDPRYEPTSTRIEVKPGETRDVTVVTHRRGSGPGALLGRHRAAVAAALVLLLAVAGIGLLRPWGTTLETAEVLQRAEAGDVLSVRLTEDGMEGRLSRGLLPPLSFRAPLDEEAAPATVLDLRAAGVEVDASVRVDRLVREAAEAQARMAYYGEDGSDVRSYAQRASMLEPASPEASSLLRKVAERMAWNAEAALEDGSRQQAEELVEECLGLVPDHPRCNEVAASL